MTAFGRGSGRVSRDLLLASVANDPDLLSELLALFRDSCHGQIGRMRRAVARSDAAALAGDAHALKGSLTALQAIDATPIVSRLEELGRDGTVRGAEQLIGEVEAAARELEATITALIRQLRGERD